MLNTLRQGQIRVLEFVSAVFLLDNDRYDSPSLTHELFESGLELGIK